MTTHTTLQNILCEPNRISVAQFKSSTQLSELPKIPALAVNMSSQITTWIPEVDLSTDLNIAEIFLHDPIPVIYHDLDSDRLNSRILDDSEVPFTNTFQRDRTYFVNRYAIREYPDMMVQNAFITPDGQIGGNVGNSRPDRLDNDVEFVDADLPPLISNSEMTIRDFVARCTGGDSFYARLDSTLPLRFSTRNRDMDDIPQLVEENNIGRLMQTFGDDVLTTRTLIQ